MLADSARLSLHLLSPSAKSFILSLTTPFVGTAKETTSPKLIYIPPTRRSWMCSTMVWLITNRSLPNCLNSEITPSNWPWIRSKWKTRTRAFKPSALYPRRWTGLCRFTSMVESLENSRCMWRRMPISCGWGLRAWWWTAQTAVSCGMLPLLLKLAWKPNSLTIQNTAKTWSVCSSLLTSLR